MERMREEYGEGDNSKEILHELRTVLSSVTGFVQLLNRNSDNPVRVKEYAAGISDCCREMAEILNREQHGTQNKEDSTLSGDIVFSLRRLIEEVNGVTARERDRKRIHCRVIYQGVEKDHFVGNRAKLSGILLNILDNAVQSSPFRGKIRVEISIKASENPNFYDLSFVVTDAGEGISSELQKRLFEGEGAPHTLVHARVLADQMGGTLSLQSIPGKGTKVYFGLRLPSASGGEKEFFAELGLNRIMLVTDNLQEGERILDLLASQRIACDFFSSGGEALRRLTRGRSEYDAVLLDEEIEDITAAEFCVDCRENVPSLPVILLSDQKEHFLGPVQIEGVREIMPKPFFFSVFRQIAVRIGTSPEAAESQETSPKSSVLAGLRFLVAEDNPLNADILKELLEMEGARCEIAGNGKAAALMFRFRRPSYYDAILMDLVMPVQNGFDAAKEIRTLSREDAKTIPILAMTAESLTDAAERTAESGMDACLEKPLEISVLTSTLAGIRKSRAGSA